MSQPAIFPRVPADVARALAQEALEQRGEVRPYGFVHRTEDSYRHTSQLPMFAPSRDGAQYERVGGNAKDRATYSRFAPDHRLFGDQL